MKIFILLFFLIITTSFTYSQVNDVPVYKKYSNFDTVPNYYEPNLHLDQPQSPYYNLKMIALASGITHGIGLINYYNYKSTGNPNHQSNFRMATYFGLGLDAVLIINIIDDRIDRKKKKK